MASKTFEVRKLWMDHDGGTKFYQVFRISAQVAWGAPVVTLGHYGKQSVAKGLGSRPINGGSTKIYPGDKYREVIGEKNRVRAGGRYLSTPAGEVTEVFNDEKAFTAYLTKMFMVNDRSDIENELGLHGVREIAATPTPAPETITSPAEHPTGWGAW